MKKVMALVMILGVVLFFAIGCSSQAPAPSPSGQETPPPAASPEKPAEVTPPKPAEEVG